MADLLHYIKKHGGESQEVEQKRARTGRHMETPIEGKTHRRTTDLLTEDEFSSRSTVRGEDDGRERNLT